MKFKDLRSFLKALKKRNDLHTIKTEVNPYLEITEISRRAQKKGGPALLFENPKDSSFPLLSNLFTSKNRVALGMGQENAESFREVGQLLAYLRSPEPPNSLKDAFSALPKLKQALNMGPSVKAKACCYENIKEGSEVDLYSLPIQTCWPEDAAPLITWPLVITRGPKQERQNLGIYRMQLLAKNKVIMRWLHHRGGALDFKEWQQKHPEQAFPVAVAIGADPATILAAVTPVPDSLSEYAFAGLLRGSKTEVTNSKLSALQVPANAEIILEGHIYPGDYADEGPFGDHTGYYNEVERFPVFTIEQMSYRNNAIYHSTYTGKPPDEPSVLGECLNEVFFPLLQQQFPEIVDFYLPPEACSYRLAVVSMKKQYAGHAKRVMMGIWSFLRQFMYTKFIVVVDDDINIRSWKEVVWAMSTRIDPRRDMTFIDNSPIDYLDFASVESGLGSKVGIDATNKIGNESKREWGKIITMTDDVIKKVDDIWGELNI